MQFRMFILCYLLVHVFIKNSVSMTGGLGVSALTGVIVGGVLGAAMLITFYFFR